MVGNIAPASWSIVGPNMAVQGSAQWGGCRQASSLVVSRLCVGNAIGPTPSTIFIRHCRHPMRLQTGGLHSNEQPMLGQRSPVRPIRRSRTLRLRVSRESDSARRAKRGSGDMSKRLARTSTHRLANHQPRRGSAHCGPECGAEFRHSSFFKHV